ncbi:thymidylate synthase [Spongiactinospora sp. 9N601]|uniref:thymidylate synthase n=1 Tax=Spongiactinospora sp. 9N601 TaxID=3375149 RepID=UPI0037AA4743
MHPAIYDRFEDAYLTVLGHVLHKYEYRPTPRGAPASECLNISFTLRDPRNRIVYLPQRRTNIVFCYAELLWYLTGRDDLNMIGYYAPKMRNYSSDGQRMTGTAYGPKLFGRHHPEGAGQWDRIVDLLAHDPGSKRAVISIFDPAELEKPDNPDVSCTIALQFLLRGGCLHAVTFMRGNDAVTGLLSDVFSFTALQEFTAHHLGVPLGTYTHHVASMHINDTDADRAATIFAADRPRASFPVIAMPPTRWSDLDLITRYEQALRLGEQQLSLRDLAWQSFQPYWQQVILLLEVYRQIRHTDHPITPGVLNALDAGHRWLIANRWPSRIPRDAA